MVQVEQAIGQSRYGALAAALRGHIVAGEWPPGMALPAEQALAAAHGVALGTMRQALALLVQQGLVERRHGKGTFVRAGLSGAPMLRFFRFGGGTGEVPSSRILSRQAVPAPEPVATQLGTEAGSPVLRLRRLRSLGGTPCLLEEIWLPLPRCAGLLEGDTADWGDLLYPLLAERCGVFVHRAVDDIGFGVLSATDARALKLPTGHPCATVRRQAHDIAGLCVETRTSLGDAHAFRYTVAIT